MLRLARVGGVFLALVIGAWFAIGWVQARDSGRADALLEATSSPSAGQAGKIRALLNSAGTLNPDRAVELSRARLAADEHNYATAIRILEAVTRAEPENVFAWSQLGFTAGAAGRIPLGQLAARHQLQLAPRL